MSLEPLRRFVQAASLAVNACGATEPPLQLLAWQLRTLLAQDDWLPAELARPRQGCSTYLLYADPVDRFSVVSYVTAPGFRSPVHDTGVWSVFGMLRGEHRLRLHDRAPDGRPAAADEVLRLRPGEVLPPEPGRMPMFQIDNPHADAPGVGIHVYGGVLAGLQSLGFDEHGEAHAHVFSYANSWIPNLWSRRHGPRPDEAGAPPTWRALPHGT
ncbi:cysteine dioxygenase family protein [Rubrivivax gelatinosus]|uniref:cysteine dioxygenase family protein n=1 Tax=Rubrivivax gelatinosus TaxID=28068 RepID=UPI001052AA62|nr:cysteine dioxygenase [Rubrivivax gelatinosus]